MTSSGSDALIDAIDNTLKTLFPPKKRQTARPNPSQAVEAAEALSQKEKKHVAGLMRVNHAGEVCAQALYQGQALTAKLDDTRQQMQAAAQEEVDHLGWCEQRLAQLDSTPSVLNPFWYAGSFMIGAIAGFAGDKYSLGFVEETEKQVTAHLQTHINKLPHHDKKTQAILEQMKIDEAHHAEVARFAGATTLPKPVQYIMRNISKIMTASSYYF